MTLLRQVCRLLPLILLLIMSGAAPAPAQEVTAQTLLKDKVVQLFRQGREIEVQGTSVVYSPDLIAFYEKRDYQPAWTNPEAAAELVKAIKTSTADGLRPEGYHLAAVELLTQPGRQAPSPEFTADRDLILSDALFRLSHDLLYGKVDPRSLFPDWNLSRPGTEIDLAQAAGEAIASGQIVQFADSLRPQTPYYRHLQEALARYQAIAAQGGWPPIPGSIPIKKGAKDSRMPAVRQRLFLAGDLKAFPEVKSSRIYDKQTLQAVRRFQQRHGLTDDGVIGPKTLEAMNVPVAQRLAQIRVNLERARWMLHQPPGKTQVVVNLAAFKLTYHGADGNEWVTRVVVGQPQLKTPLVNSKINRIIFNPTWTVPESIIKKEFLPKIQDNPGYLGRNHYRVTGHDPLEIVQEPGPWNALGRVKFMFPNEYDIYLHDTPSRHLFSQQSRTFSHGCIRVQHPLHLALLLLDSPKWDMERIRDIISTRKTREVYFKNPVPIMVIYRTVDVEADGSLVFLPDVYQRDFTVLGALEKSETGS